MAKRASDAFDFERLERVVSALIEEQRRLRHENEGLRRDLAARDDRVQHLDEQMIDLNQRRTDALKRVDDLISHIDDYENRIARGSGASE